MNDVYTKLTVDTHHYPFNAFRPVTVFIERMNVLELSRYIKIPEFGLKNKDMLKDIYTYASCRRI